MYTHSSETHHMIALQFWYFMKNSILLKTKDSLDKDVNY